MGSWLQEAIEDYSRQYILEKIIFDVNGWRFLAFGFLNYVDNLTLTNESLEDKDNHIIKSLENIEVICEDLIKTVKFLKDIRPPDEYYFGKVKNEEYCQEMIDAIQNDIQQKYEEQWLTQKD